MTPARSICDRAEALLRPADELAIATDASADPVLVGVATKRQSLVIAIDRSEYDGLAFAKACGFEFRQPTAMERLKSKTA